MATVYLARDLAQDRDVAIKVLLPDLASVLGPERFKREIGVASQLQHPNILWIFESGAAAGTLYFTMPFVEGESLRTRLDRDRQLPVNEALRIAGDVASALDLAHSKGIVHRDIKPENILLQSDGQVMVADFGIARAVSTAGDEKLTKTGMTLGTPTYMSPEQATAERVIDGRSDIYALGCVLYEMLAGTPPFTGPNAQAITARHIMDDAPAVSTIRRTVPMHVEQTIRVAMAKAPVDRFTKASEFVKALGDATGKTVAAYAGAAVPTGGHAPARRGIPAKTRSPALLAAMIAMPVLLLGGGFLFMRGSVGEATSGSSVPRHARVAVMYFQDASGGELGYLADGLTEALIEEFTRIDGVNVISRNGVLPFRGSSEFGDVAKRLQAGLVLTGSLEDRGDSLRISLQLVDSTGAPVVAEPLQVAVRSGDLLAAREAVTLQASQLVLRQIGRNVALAASRGSTRNATAWGLLQRAEHTRKSAMTALDGGDRERWDREMHRADSLLQAAGAADPGWADPHVHRARLALERSRYADDRLLSVQWVEEGIAHADQAIATDPQHSGAHEIRGTLRYRLSGSEPNVSVAQRLFASAEEDLTKATQLNPRNATAWFFLSDLRAAESDYVQSAFAAQRAYEADQYMERASDILWQLFATNYSMEQHSSGKRYCEEGARRFPSEPSFIRCQLWMMTTRADSADPARARRLIEELEKVNPPAQWEFVRREAQMLLAAVMVRAARQKPALLDSARTLLVASRGDRSIDPGGVLLSREAFVRTMMGDKDTAIQLLQRFFLQNPAERERFGRENDWWWRGLQEDPRFARLTSGG